MAQRVESPARSHPSLSWSSLHTSAHTHRFVSSTRADCSVLRWSCKGYKRQGTFVSRRREKGAFLGGSCWIRWATPKAAGDTERNRLVTGLHITVFPVFVVLKIHSICTAQYLIWIFFSHCLIICSLIYFKCKGLKTAATGHNKKSRLAKFMLAIPKIRFKNSGDKNHWN